MKIDRKVHWKKREKASDAGISTWIYWYSAEAKRWIVAEESNVTVSGRQLARMRWELEKMTVR